MVSELVDLFAQPICKEAFDGVHDLGMDSASPLMKKARVGGLVGQRVLECVLKLGNETRFVKKLPRLEPREPLTKTLLGLLGDRLQQRERYVPAENGRSLQ